jgi:hypothetical protein
VIEMLKFVLFLTIRNERKEKSKWEEKRTSFSSVF